MKHVGVFLISVYWILEQFWSYFGSIFEVILALKNELKTSEWGLLGNGLVHPLGTWLDRGLLPEEALFPAAAAGNDLKSCWEPE